MNNKNDIICFSEGEYSDYGLMGHFIVLELFSCKLESDAYLTEVEPEIDVMEYFDRSGGPWKRLETPVKIGTCAPAKNGDGFQAFLIRKKLIKPFDVKEYHVGSYGRFKLIEDY